MVGDAKRKTAQKHFAPPNSYGNITDTSAIQKPAKQAPQKQKTNGKLPKPDRRKQLQEGLPREKNSCIK